MLLLLQRFCMNGHKKQQLQQEQQRQNSTEAIAIASVIRTHIHDKYQKMQLFEQLFGITQPSIKL